MARVTVEDCLERDPNRFALCILAAKRARQLNHGQPSKVVSENRAAVTALREIAEGAIRPSVDVAGVLDEYARERNALEEAQDTSAMPAVPTLLDGSERRTR